MVPPSPHAKLFALAGARRELEIEMTGSDKTSPPVSCAGTGSELVPGGCDEALSRMPAGRYQMAFGYAGVPGVEAILPRYFTSGQLCRQPVPADCTRASTDVYGPHCSWCTMSDYHRIEINASNHDSLVVPALHRCDDCKWDVREVWETGGFPRTRYVDDSSRTSCLLFARPCFLTKS